MRRRLRWLGHATVLLDVGGARLLTDPVLGTRLAHLRRHGPAPDPPRHVDAVLVSHVHRDHLDRRSLRRVAGPDTTVVVPRGAAGLVARLGFGAVREVEAGDTVTIGGAAVRAVPAWHPARRGPCAPLLASVGFVADRIWFAGDTGPDDGLAALRGLVDVALLPVWGWGPTLGPGHLDPAAAAGVVAQVAPAVAIPIHWGTFLPAGFGRRHARLLTEPPREFARHTAARAPGTRVVVLEAGAAWEDDGGA
ncbi:MAG TPA: MBL fold metallo-hydrolase [Baekduia sp.]|nr:MBL fold metallo-hydrolase [Baekduia sp.]